MSLSAVKKMLTTMRGYQRRTVIIPAIVSIGNFKFDCTAYDISLTGIRLKIDLPIEKGTEVLIRLKNKLVRTAKVIWSANGFVGLCFLDEPIEVKAGLGSLAIGLE